MGSEVELSGNAEESVPEVELPTSSELVLFDASVEDSVVNKEAALLQEVSRRQESNRQMKLPVHLKKGVFFFDYEIDSCYDSFIINCRWSGRCRVPKYNYSITWNDNVSKEDLN